jgi:hypothetical protein
VSLGPMEPGHLRMLVTLCIAAVFATACDNDPPTRPGSGTPRGPAFAVPSVGPIILLSRAEQLRTAQFRTDSAAFHVLIATARLRGQAGDSVNLKLEVDPAVLAAAGNSVRLLVSAGQNTKSFSFQELETGPLVYRFVTSDTVTIAYHITRQIARIGVGNIHLVQLTSARVETSYTMWPPSADAGAGLAPLGQVLAGGGRGGSGTVCALSSQSGTCGAITWTIDPYAPGFVFSGFQSDPQSTGPSHRITIVFTSDVASISTTINDPTWPGNKMLVYDGNKFVDSASFSFSGQPGVNVPSTRTLSGRITKVELLPADSDYVTYEAQITVDSKTRLNISCAPIPVVRGATVTCTATLSTNKAFIVVLSEGASPDGSPMLIAGTSINSGKGWQTSGPALTVRP